MRFRIEQVFGASADAVIAALVDPSYLAALGGLPDLGAPEIRTQSVDGSKVKQELVFRFTGHLPGAVRRVIDPAKLSWIEVDEIDVDSRRCAFRMVPVHYPKFFRCDGTWSVSDQPASTALRVIEGDMKVDSPVPFVGGQVEKAIVSGLRERLAAEPSVFARWHGGR